MTKRNLTASLIVSLAIVAVTAGFIAAGARPELGLDLRGGISAIYSPVLAEGEEAPEDFDQVLDETISVIRERVDSLGVAEPNISRQGDDVLVQLPGLEDPDRAREIIGTTAQLTFRPVAFVASPDTPPYEALPECGTAIPRDEALSLVAEAQPATPEGEDGPSPGEEGTPSPDASPTVEASPTAGATETPDGQSADRATVVAAGEGETTPAEEAPPTGEATATEVPTPDPSPTGTPTDEADEDGAATEPGVLPELPEEDEGVLCGAPDDATDGGGGGGEGGDEVVSKYVVGPSALTGDTVDDALATLSGGGQAGGGWAVSLELDAEGAEQFANITAELACQRDQGQPGLLAIVLDNRVRSAPQMNPSVACGEGITGGQAQITTGAPTQEESENEARDLALVLKTGALPITLEPSTFQTISPTLGAESLEAGLIAGLIGLLLVAIYLVFFYRWLGVVAIGALSIFGVLMFGIITLLGEVGFALTLAGIAGIVVSIGITADSSIIFFERIRDEVGLGKTVRTSVKRAFDSAFRTNLAGNTVTLAAAIILYFLAVGPVRGFALTLGIATVLDIVILYFYSRPAIGLLSRSGRLITRESIRSSRPAAEGSTS